MRVDKISAKGWQGAADRLRDLLARDLWVVAGLSLAGTSLGVALLMIS